MTIKIPEPKGFNPVDMPWARAVTDYIRTQQGDSGYVKGALGNLLNAQSGIFTAIEETNSQIAEVGDLTGVSQDVSVGEPTAPILDTGLAMITATWDGVYAPQDYEPLVVPLPERIGQMITEASLTLPPPYDPEVGGEPVDPFVAVGTPFRSGSTVFAASDIGAAVGDTVYVRFRSVKAGTVDEGFISDISSIVVTGVARVDLNDAVNEFLDEINDKATTAIDAANGKNKIVFSTSPASGTTGYVAGDVWFQTSGSLIIGQWEFTTSWQQRTLDNAVIANLDAGKITAGYLDVANRVQAGSILTSKLVVADYSNMVIDPNITEEVGTNWIAGDAALGFPQTPMVKAASGGATRSDFALSNPGAGSFSAMSSPIPAQAGEEYYLDFEARASASALSIYLIAYDLSGTFIGIMSLVNVEAGTDWGVVNNTNVNLAAAPEGTASVKVLVYSPSTTAANQHAVTGFFLRRKNGGELIVDGAITAEKVTMNEAFADKFWANEGNFGQVTAAMLDADAINGRIIRGAEIYGTFISGSEYHLNAFTSEVVQYTNTFTSATGWTAGNAGTTVSIDSTSGQSGSTSLKVTAASNPVVQWTPPTYTEIGTTELTFWVLSPVATKLTVNNNNKRYIQRDIPAGVWTLFSTEGWSLVEPGREQVGGTVKFLTDVATTFNIDNLRLVTRAGANREIRLVRDASGTPMLESTTESGAITMRLGAYPTYAELVIGGNTIRGGVGFTAKETSLGSSVLLHAGGIRHDPLTSSAPFLIDNKGLGGRGIHIKDQTTTNGPRFVRVESVNGPIELIPGTGQGVHVNGPLYQNGTLVTTTLALPDPIISIGSTTSSVTAAASTWQNITGQLNQTFGVLPKDLLVRVDANAICSASTGYTRIGVRTTGAGATGEDSDSFGNVSAGFSPFSFSTLQTTVTLTKFVIVPAGATITNFRMYAMRSASSGTHITNYAVMNVTPVKWMN